MNYKDIQNKAIMKTKHTPGKWSYTNVYSDEREIGSLVYCKIISENKGIGFAGTYGGKNYKIIPAEEAEANAKLIAAAPDMLDALMVAKAHLEYAIEFGAGAGGESKAIEIIDRAIKKATG